MRSGRMRRRSAADAFPRVGIGNASGSDLTGPSRHLQDASRLASGTRACPDGQITVNDVEVALVTRTRQIRDPQLRAVVETAVSAVLAAMPTWAAEARQANERAARDKNL